MDLKNVDSALRIGQYQSYGNLNFDSTQMIFSKFDILDETRFEPFIESFNINERKTLVKTSKGEYTTDPKFYNLSNKFLYSVRYKSSQMSQGYFQINIRDEKGKIVKKIKDDGHSLELAKTSTNDKYIAAERYNEEMIKDIENLRVFISQTKPGNADIVFYNENGEQIGLIENGIEVRWI